MSTTAIVDNRPAPESTAAPYPAKVLAHSVTPDGDEIVTMQVPIHRFILPEFNTHRALSKNSASSRAIPVKRQIEMLRENPAYPLVWATEKSGMQGGEPLDVEDTTLAKHKWRQMMEQAIKTSLDLRELGLHKSLTNRLLEPFMWHHVVVTGTAWANFYEQRDSILAQPEIAGPARAMLAAYAASTPTLLREGEWHLPYVTDADRDRVRFRAAKQRAADPIAVAAHTLGVERALAQVSAARCARVSYLTNPVTDADGNVVEEARVDLDKDHDLYLRLTDAQPKHWSPLEHPATPWHQNKQVEDVFFVDDDGTLVRVGLTHLPRIGNLYGWRSLRVVVEAREGAVTFR